MSKTLSRPRCPLQLETLEDRVVPTADLVIQWNDAAREAVRIAGTPATAVSRIMAITQAAVYDSVNALTRTHEPYLIDTLAHPRASREAAVAAAAHWALVSFYPLQAGGPDGLDAKLTASLATIPDGKAEDDGVALGRSVATQILALRQGDGSGVVPPPYVGSNEPGKWRPTSAATGLHPHWADVTPFALASNEQFRPAAPPALGSDAYWVAFNEVRDYGSINSTLRTADQTAMARFWANGAGTATPIGHLNLMAQIVAEQQGNTLEENARLFAALNVAMADAVISCWDAKYEPTYNFWRPITGIREAANDSDDRTEAVADWAPLLGTPPFPAYTSGHATVSGTAAAVLADFFETDNIAFTLPSQNTALPARSFDRLSDAAAESALSRMYGGIHWSFDNDVGLTAGNAIGQYVVANFLRPVEREATAGVVNGELIVIGTAGGDLVSIRRAGNSLIVWANGEELGQFAVTIASVVVDGRDGNDVILVSHQVHTDAELYGGAGNDLVSGGKGNDRIYGEAGDDILLGNHGDDRLDGGDGDDILLGGQGDDELFGGPGDDWLFGGPGRDRILP